MDIGSIPRRMMGIIVVLIVIILVTVPILGGFTESDPGETGTNASGSEVSIAELAPGTAFKLGEDSTGLYINDTPINGYDHNIKIFSESIQISFGSADLVTYAVNLVAGSSYTMDLIYDGSTVTGMLGTTERNVEASTLYITYVGEISGDFLVESDLTYIESLPAYVNAEDTVIMTPGTNIQTVYIGTYDDMAYCGPGANMDTFTLIAGESDGIAIQLTGYDYNPLVDSIYIFVPKDYVISEPVEAQVSGPVADMVDLVPMILIIGLIVAVVGMFLYWRIDRGGGESEDLNPEAPDDSEVRE